MEEKWKEVYGFDVLYEVSDKGRVRTKYDKQRGYTEEYKMLEPTDNGNGYLRFNWRKKRKQRTVYLHQLVAQAFVDNPNGYIEINHKDENKRNNDASNLEWCEHQYNCAYGTRNERSGANHNRAVTCIENGKRFESVQKAAEWAQVGKTAISNCLNGRSKTCCGYTWRYCDEV